jgi:Peptidase family M23
VNIGKNVLRVLGVWWILLLTPLAQAGPSYEAFGESLNAHGWSIQSWGSLISTQTTPVLRGSQSAMVIYTSAMGVFKPVASGGFNTSGYKHLTFAVYNSTNADDLWLVAETTGGQLGTYLRVADYADRWGTPAGKWTWVRIPISSLGLGSAPTLAYFSVASGKANATAYFDEVGFAASSILYEGLASNSASLHAYAPGIQFWSWNVGRSYYKSGTNYWLKATPTSSTNWAGVQFQHRTGGVIASEYGAVSVRFMQAESPNLQTLYVSLANLSGAKIGTSRVLGSGYLPSIVEFQKGEWYDVAIPLSDFGVNSGTTIGGIIIETGSNIPFWIDDARLVQQLSRPLTTWRKNDPFGSHWRKEYCKDAAGEDDQTNPKVHVGTDYSASAGTFVYAASRGFVKQSDILTDWGQYIVVQHESGMATSYLHTDLLSNLSIGSEVQRGQHIGTSSYITGAHLHFGIRLQNVFGISDYLARAGALTKKGCTIKTTVYPRFSDRFINPDRLDGLSIP